MPLKDSFIYWVYVFVVSTLATIALILLGMAKYSPGLSKRIMSMLPSTQHLVLLIFALNVVCTGYVFSLKNGFV